MMKKTFFSLFFAVAMILSMSFVAEVGANHNPFSAQAQTAKVKKKKVGVIRNIYRGGKFVGRQVWNGTRWVGVKSYQGSKYIGKKTWQGTKYVGKKTWKGTKWIGRKIY
jgi:hypothetical protein